MEQISVRVNEWSLTQGMVGYKRILESYGITVETDDFGIVVTKEALQKLPEAYFAYFLEKYSYARSNERTLRGLHNKWKKGDKEAKREINKKLKDIDSKIKKYFSTYEVGISLREHIEVYRNEKEHSEEMDKHLNAIIDRLKDKEIEEKLTSNIFKPVQLKPFYGQVSFLNVSKNALTIDEQIEQFRQDFIEPILAEWAFVDCLKKDDKERCMKLLEETSHKNLASLKRTFRKKNIDEIKEYVQQEILQCSFTGFPLAFYNFEEKTFSPLALSVDKALNVTWNSEGEAFFPICALARLLLFCAAAGSTVSNQKNVFVQFDGPFDEIYRVNEHYNTEADRDKTFDEIIFDIVKETKMRADWINRNYLILEYESDYDSKRTLLDYMIMTPSLVKLFQNHSKLFSFIHYSYRVMFIKLLLKHIDTKQMIAEVLREKLKKSYSPLDVLYMTTLRHLHQTYIKEEKEMDTTTQQKKIWVLYKSAEAVREKIGLKKAQGIAYRLLNAAQAGDKHTFMDTVMRTYISSEQDMPSLLLEALHEKEMDFPTVANAWIAGLISKSNGGEGINAE